MFSFILIALLFVLFLILIVLFATIDILIEFEKQGACIRHLVRVKWLFLSHVLKDSSAPDDTDLAQSDEETVPEKNDPDPSESSPDAQDSKSKFKWGVRESIVALRLLIGPVLKLLEDILRTIHIHHLKCDMRFGFDDPAHTGMAYGYFHALKGYVLHRCAKAQIDAEPVFVDEVMDIFAVTQFRFRIASLIPVILRFVLNRNVLRVSWAYFRNKSIS